MKRKTLVFKSLFWLFSLSINYSQSLPHLYLGYIALIFLILSCGFSAISAISSWCTSHSSGNTFSLYELAWKSPDFKLGSLLLLFYILFLCLPSWGELLFGPISTNTIQFSSLSAILSLNISISIMLYPSVAETFLNWRELIPSPAWFPLVITPS